MPNRNQTELWCAELRAYFDRGERSEFYLSLYDVNQHPGCEEVFRRMGFAITVNPMDETVIIRRTSPNFSTRETGCPPFIDNPVLRRAPAQPTDWFTYPPIILDEFRIPDPVCPPKPYQCFKDWTKEIDHSD